MHIINVFSDTEAGSTYEHSQFFRTVTRTISLYGTAKLLSDGVAGRFVVLQSECYFGCGEDGDGGYDEVE